MWTVLFSLQKVFYHFISFCTFFFFKLLRKQKLLLVFWINHALSFSSSVLILSGPSFALPLRLVSSLSLCLCIMHILNPRQVKYHLFQNVFPESCDWQYFHPLLNWDGTSSVWNLWHLYFTLCFCKPLYSKLLGSRIYVLLIFPFFYELCTKL